MEKRTGERRRSARAEARSKIWTEQLPLALAAVLVITGAAIVVAVILAPSPPSGSTPPSGLVSALPSFVTLPPTPAPTSTSTPIPTLQTTPSATPQPTPRTIAETGIDLTWQSTSLLPGTSSDPATQTILVAGVAHGPFGYLAVGEVIDGFLTETGATGAIHPALWTSPGGRSWTLASTTAFGTAIPGGVAANGNEELVLATTADATVVLRSSNGQTWTDATPPDARVQRLAAAGPGFIAIGERISDHQQAIWSSVDGTTWDRTWESDVTLGEFLNTIAGRADGSVVVGGTQLQAESGIRATALVSPDGLQWTRVDAAHLPASMGFDAIGVGADGAWYGAGFDQALGGIGIWRSTNGTDWSATTFGPAQLTEQPGDTGSVSTIFGFDGRTMLLAYTSCCGDPPQRALASRSGQTWERLDRSTVVKSARITDLIVEPDRILAVGSINRAAGVWIATRAPRNGVEFATELTPPVSADVCGSGVDLNVKVVVDRSGTVARIHLVRTDEPAAQIPGVVWPYGWQAAAGPPLTISDATGTVVAREGDELTLSDGLARGGSYHICQLNGAPVWGG